MTQSKLPPRWRYTRNAYYYRVPKGQEHLWDGKQTFRLGKTLSEAWASWAEHMGTVETPATPNMNHVFDRFWNEYVMVELAESTRDSYQWHMAKLRKTFGVMHPSSIKPAHVFRYRAKRAKKAKAAANREVSVLSSALQFATDQGLIDRNPLRGQISRRTRAVRETPRTRVPSLQELEAFCKVNPHLKGYVNLKRITGLRQGQLLAINLTDQWEDGALHPITSKGGKDMRYIGDGLEIAISSILKRRLPVGHLFVTRKGTPVTAGGFRSSWRRAMTRFVAQGGERFNEHDIRKTVAVKAKSLEEAQKLLGHQESKTTARVYRIGTEDVEVLE